jgi:hypothetical protein
MAASCGKIIRDFGFPRRISRGLLHDKPFCAGFDPNPEHIGPETSPGSLAVDGGCNTSFLTGRSADDDIGSFTRIIPSDVSKDWYSKSEIPNALTAPRVDFAERNRLNAGALEADRVTADARK